MGYVLYQTNLSYILIDILLYLSMCVISSNRSVICSFCRGMALLCHPIDVSCLHIDHLGNV